jgi:hypothetical protein
MPTSNPIGGGPWVDLVRALGVHAGLPFSANAETQSVAPEPSTGPLWSRGATGYDYPVPGGAANQLMITIGDDEQGYRNVPLIVPGQENVQELLAGKITPAQVRKSAAWADTAGVGHFRTLAEALEYERDYHKQLEQLYR